MTAPSQALALLQAALPPGLVPLAARPSSGHKGTFGRVTIIGGSRGMSGAVALAGMAALRSGAGLVTLGVPAVCADVVASFQPAYMCRGLPSDERGRLSDEARTEVAELTAGADAIAVGPGLGQSSAVRATVTTLFKEVTQPLIVDADGLNALAARGSLAGAAGPRILTPHPGEFARLAAALPSDLRRDVARSENRESRAEQMEQAVELAQRFGLIMILKGHGTLVTDGRRRYINPTGNPGMATGGTGDVLTGVITALCGQGFAPWEAACLGVFAHGLAGDLAADRWGQMGLTAPDLIDWLAIAFQRLSQNDPLRLASEIEDENT